MCVCIIQGQIKTGHVLHSQLETRAVQRIEFRQIAYNNESRCDRRRHHNHHHHQQ